MRYGVTAASDPNPVVQEVMYPSFCSLGRRIFLLCHYQHRDVWLTSVSFQPLHFNPSMLRLPSAFVVAARRGAD